VVDWRQADGTGRGLCNRITQPPCVSGRTVQSPARVVQRALCSLWRFPTTLGAGRRCTKAGHRRLSNPNVLRRYARRRNDRLGSQAAEAVVIKLILKRKKAGDKST